MVGLRGPAIAHNCAFALSGRPLFQRTLMAALSIAFFHHHRAATSSWNDLPPCERPPEHVDGILKVISKQWRSPFFGLFFALNCPEPIEQTQPESGQ